MTTNKWIWSSMTHPINWEYLNDLNRTRFHPRSCLLASLLTYILSDPQCNAWVNEFGPCLCLCQCQCILSNIIKFSISLSLTLVAMLSWWFVCGFVNWSYYFNQLQYFCWMLVRLLPKLVSIWMCIYVCLHVYCVLSVYKNHNQNCADQFLIKR